MIKNNIYFRQEKKLFDKICEYRVKCNCSHTMIIIQNDRVICSYCGKWVYRTPEIEFKYKLREKMKGDKKQDE